MANGIKFPFKNTQLGGMFEQTTTTEQTIKSNLIAFLTLRKGQRPMDNGLYSPLYDFIFEPFDEIADQQLKEKLKQKLGKYFPELVLKKIVNYFDENENAINCKIYYTISSLGNIPGEVEVAIITET